MNVLVASDTHGRADRLREALERTAPAALLFLGDGLIDLARVDMGTIPVRAVRGNCDTFGGEYPTMRLEVLGGVRILMMHGHLFDVTRAIYAAIEADADVLLYGHTHEPFSRVIAPSELDESGSRQRPLAVLCPGSLGDPRSGAPTFGTLEIRENGVLPAIGVL